MLGSRRRSAFGEAVLTRDGFLFADPVADPPGFLLNRLRIPVDPSQPLTIPLQQEGGGTLHLRFDKPPDDPFSGGSLPFVIQDGHLEFDLGTLQNWAFMNNIMPGTSELVVPNLPSGNYSFCRAYRATTEDTGGGSSAPSRRCVDGFLPLFGELTLSAPRSPD